MTLKKRVTDIHESALENGTFLGVKCPIYSPEHEKVYVSNTYLLSPENGKCILLDK